MQSFHSQSQDSRPETSPQVVLDISIQAINGAVVVGQIDCGQVRLVAPELRNRPFGVDTVRLAIAALSQLCPERHPNFFDHHPCTCLYDNLPVVPRRADGVRELVGSLVGEHWLLRAPDVAQVCIAVLLPREIARRLPVHEGRVAAIIGFERSDKVSLPPLHD